MAKLMSAPVPAVALILATALGACMPAARSTPPPAPRSAPAGQEEIGAGPQIEDMEVVVARRDILGDATYTLPLVANSWVEAELDFLVNQRSSVVRRWIERGDFYEPFIRSVLESHGLPNDLHHLAMIESGFVPTARSRAGAVGIWQFMPATGREMGLRIDGEVDERMDPVRSTRAAARHLRWLHNTHGGDWALAAAAYNAGTGRISRGLQNFGVTNFWDLARHGDLADETRHYVPRLYAMTVIARNRDRFGLPTLAAQGSFAFDSILVEFPTPLDEIARLGSASEADLVGLNPHLLSRVAPGGYWVWVPAGQGENLQRAYLASSFRRSGGLGEYAVRTGDTLGRIADRSGLRAARIRELNPAVNFDRLQAGQTIRLPGEALQRIAARVAADETRTAAATPRGGASRGGAGSHTVARGETLSAIAVRYGVTVGELQEANRIRGTTIRVGQTLAIPGGSVASASAPVEHTVVAGETLSGIASQYGVTVAGIQDANSIQGSTIRIGQRLTIPGAYAAGMNGGPSADPAEHTVSAGETLSAIAVQYGVTVGAIQAENGLQGSTIRVGQRLAIPAVNGGGRTAAAPAAAPAPSSAPAPAPAPAAQEHTVSAGETLSRIAARYAVSVASIQRANDIQGSTIRVGQRLAIPGGGSGATSPAPAPAAAEHTVSSGETLSGIASRYGVTIAQIQRANDIQGSTIRIGQRLTIPGGRAAPEPVHHTVASGENLTRIAARYGVTIEQIQRANNLENSTIRIGQRLLIPVE